MERATIAEDRKYFLLRGEGGEEARTVDESGSFTAGPKTLSRNSSVASNSSVTTTTSSSGGEEEEEDFAMAWFPCLRNRKFGEIRVTVGRRKTR